MNEPTNNPAGTRASLGLARRPFAAVARISLLTIVIAILGACGAQQGNADSASPSEPPATDEQAVGNTPEAQGETEASAPATEDDELGPPILGDEDAPVTIVEYADYR